MRIVMLCQEKKTQKEKEKENTYDRPKNTKKRKFGWKINLNAPYEPFDNDNDYRNRLMGHSSWNFHLRSRYVYARWCWIWNIGHMRSSDGHLTLTIQLVDLCTKNFSWMMNRNCWSCEISLWEMKFDVEKMTIKYYCTA